MAPIVDHHAAMAEAFSTDRTAAGGSAAHLTTVKNHRADGQFGSPTIVVVADDNDFDDTQDENEFDSAVATIPRIGEMITHASSSLFMDDCDDYYNDSSGIFPEEAITTADQKTSALMTSFDALEDIDLLSPTSTPSKEQLHDLHQYTTTSDNSAAVIMFSTDEELARQLQAEEDEYARQQRDIIFRKAQTTAKATATSPPRKLKKSWLDDLIGEPFPSEMRRNYARSDSQNTTSTNSGLMAAIAAAEARLTSAASDSSVLVDRSNTTSSCSSINMDESINKLSTSISKWWSSKVVISPQNNNNQDIPTTSSSEDPPRFTDNGCEGYYLGDFLTDTNNNPIQPLQRHGQGIMTYKSGDTFTGNFQNNVFHGWGIYLWSDGDKQRGTWQHGLRHGPCIFHHAASDVVEYGYYDQEGKVVGEGVRLNAERTKAWKLVDGKRLEGTIELEEAERIVAERFECFPIPVAAKRREI
eukprot:scaffold8552_cov114-Skeletonema_menzelii.AAC.2